MNYMQTPRLEITKAINKVIISSFILSIISFTVSFLLHTTLNGGLLQ